MPDANLRADEQKLANRIEEATLSALDEFRNNIEIKTELNEGDQPSYRTVTITIRCHPDSFAVAVQACRKDWNVVSQSDDAASRSARLTCTIPDSYKDEASLPDAYPQTFEINLLESDKVGSAENEASNESDSDGITLLLSGGGFRATLFHLGVIRYLREADKLKDVKEIFSVSGGSILAGHLALNWDHYIGSETQFDEAAAKLVDFTKKGIREVVLQGYLLLFLIGATAIAACLSFVLFWYDASLIHKLIAGSSLVAIGAILIFLERLLRPVATLQRIYQKLYGNKKQNNITEDVDFYFLTTNLTTGNIACFTRDRIYWDVQGKPATEGNASSVLTDATTIAECVTASSAFPPLFSPWLFVPKRFSIDNSVLKDTQCFTDGGVFDNLGLRACKWLSTNDHDVLVSDAERKFDWSTDGSFRLIVGRATRATDVLMNRVNQLEFELLEVSEDVYDLDQFDSVKFARLKKDFESSSLSEDLQRRIRKIRTDLDAFSEIEIQGLFSTGVLAAKAADDDAPTWGTGITTVDNGMPIGSNSPKWLPIPELSRQQANNAPSLLDKSEQPNLWWKTLSHWSGSLIMLAILGTVFVLINPLTIGCIQQFPRSVSGFQAEHVTPVADETRPFLSALTPMLAQMARFQPEGRPNNYYIVESRNLGTYTNSMQPHPFTFSLKLNEGGDIFAQEAFIWFPENGAIKFLSKHENTFSVSEPSRQGRLMVLAGIAKDDAQSKLGTDQLHFETEDIQ